MKKSLSLLLAVVFTSSLVLAPSAKAEIPVRAKAFMTIAAYGTAGGALVGAASMAFGGTSRNIAQGASLGLYAGIIFGAYVLVSHHNKRYGSYDDRNSPYSESSDIYSDEYREDEGGSGRNTTRGGFFDRYEVMQDKFGTKRGSKMPPLQINFLQMEF